MKSSSDGIVGPAPSRLLETGLHCSRANLRAESDVVFSPLFASSSVSTSLVLAKQNDEKYTTHVKRENVSASFLPVWSISTSRDGLPSFTVNTTLNLGPEMSTEHQSIYTPRIALSSTHYEQNRKLMDSTTSSFFTDPSSLNDLKGQTPGPVRPEDSCRVENTIYSPASSFPLPMLPSSQKSFVQQQPTNFYHSYFSSTQNLPLSRLLSRASESESCNVFSHFSPLIPQPTVASMSFAESLVFSLQFSDTTTNCCFPSMLQERGVTVENTVNVSPKKRREWSQSRWRPKRPNVKGGTTQRREKAFFSTSVSSGVTSETDALVPQKKNSSFYAVDMLPKDNRRPLSTTGACRKTSATSGGSKDDHCKSVAEMVACHLVPPSQSHTADGYLLESSPAESTVSLSPPCTLLTSDFATSTKITAAHSISYSSYSSSSSPVIQPPPPTLSEMNCSENNCSATSHYMICVDGTSHSEEGERKASSSPLERCGSTSDFGTSKKVATKPSCSSTCDRPFSLSIQNDHEDSQHIPRLSSQPFRPSPPLRAIPLPFSSLSCSIISEPRWKPPHAAAAISDREGTFYKNPICGSDMHFVETENSSIKRLESTREADVLLNVPDCESSISHSPQAHSSTTPTRKLHSSFIPKNFTLEQRHRAHQEVRWDEPHLHYPRVKLPDKELNLGFTEELRRRLEQRRKQIAYGKSTCGYRHYRLVIEKIGDREYHNPMHPVTPRPDFNSSKRAFDKVLNTWRRQLHKWDEWHGEAHKKRQETCGKEWKSAKNEANTSNEPYSPKKRRLTSHTEEEAILDEVSLEHKRIKRKSARKNCFATSPPYPQEGSESASSSRSHSCSSLSSSSAFTSEGQQVFGLLHIATLRELGLCISADEANNPPPLSQSTPHLLSPSTTLLPDTPFTTVMLHDTPYSSSALMGRECGSPLHSQANEGRATNGSPSSSVASTPLLSGVINRSFRGMSESCSHPSAAAPFLPHTIISIAEDAFSDVRLPSESAWCTNSHGARKGSLSTVKNTERGDGKSLIADRHKKVEEQNMKAVSFLPDLHKNENEEQMDLTISPIVGTGRSDWCRNNSFASTVPMSRPTSTRSLFSPPNWPSNSHELFGFPALDSSRNTASEQFMLLDEGFYDGWSEASLTILNPSSQMDSGANRSVRSIPSPSGSNQGHVHPYYSMYTSAASAGLRPTSSLSSTLFGLLSPYSFLLSPQDGSAPSSRNR